MKGRRIVKALVGLSLIGQPLAAENVAYPETRRDEVLETHFGTQVADPYRWLEGDVKTDPAVRAWVDRQDAVTRAYLDTLPGRTVVREQLEQVWNFEKLTAPRERAGRLFFERNSGLQNQNVLFVQDRGKPPRALLDPNALSKTGQIVVRDWHPTKAGDKVLYARQINGADSRRLHVIDVAAGGDTELPIEGVRTPTFAWSADGGGIFYTRYDPVAPGTGPAPPVVYFHRLGTAQSDDRRVFATADSSLIVWPHTTPDGRWLVIEVAATDGTRGDVILIDLADPQQRQIPLRLGMDASWRYIGSARGRLVFLTTAGAPMGRVVSLDPLGGADQAPQVIAPPGESPIQQAVIAGDTVVTRSLQGIRSRMHRYGVDGRDLGAVALPDLTVAGPLTGQPDSRGLYVTLSSMIMPPTLYRMDTRSGAMKRVRAPTASWRPRDYVVRQITAVSRDGTRVPVTLAYRRDAAGKLPRPTMLMVYGGWGVSVDVGFYESRFAWMKLGGVFAIAHARGGGELGEAWHQAGIRERHTNTIDDYLAAAQTLHAQGIATPRQTVAYGSSNGGMMSTAAINKRPDLFGAALPRVAVTDLVRFTQFPPGQTWAQEIGDPATPEGFANVIRWSPLHTIADGKEYPAVLVNTADSDDRVVPLHSFKYVAALQAADIGDRPHLLRLDRDAGHGEGKSTGQLIAEFTDLWTFAAANTGMALPPLTKRSRP